MNSDTEWLLGNQIQIMRALAIVLSRGSHSIVAAEQINGSADLTAAYVAEQKRFAAELQAEVSRA